MSHTVTVTRTTTTSSTTAVLLNIGYFKKPEGILKLLHVILGILVVGLLGHYISYGYTSFATAELYFLIVASACLITSVLLLFSCFISIATATILPKTIFEVLFHGAAAILLVIGAAVYLSRLQEYTRMNYYNYRMAAAELVHFPILSFLLFVGAAHYLHVVVARNARYVEGGMLEPGYGAKILASVIGLVNSILYGIATFFSYRNYKSG